MTGESADSLRVSVVEVPRFVGVDARRSENPVVAFRHLQRRIEAVGTATSAGDEDVAKPGGAGTRNHLGAVRIEVRVVKMGVGIEEDRVI